MISVIFKRLAPVALSIMVLCGALASADSRPNFQENTFVGNGGNAGDLELQITLNQIQATIKTIDGSSVNLCECPEEYEGRAICKYLANMNDEQKKFCQKILSTKSTEVSQLIPKLKFTWVDSYMAVKQSGGDRLSDAIAQSETKNIILNLDKFLSLKPSDRVFLVSHEIFHLIKIDGEYTADDKAKGPFQDGEGGRQLLNSLGSAIAMEAFNQNIYAKQMSAILRSKNYVKNWLSLFLSGRSGSDDKSTFKMDKYTGVELEYRRDFTLSLGASIFYRSVSGDEKYFTSTTAESTEQSLGLVGTWKLSPFADPMTASGQSYFILGIGAEHLNGEHILDDTFSNFKEEDRSTSPIIRIQYFFPLNGGFWISGGAQGSWHKYEYTENNFKSNSNQIYYSLGVSYAF